MVPRPSGSAVERGAETLQIPADTLIFFEQAAVLLHHIDPRPAVARVDHQAHRAARSPGSGRRGRREDRRPGSGKAVVLHAGADHQVEGAAASSRTLLDRELMQFGDFPDCTCAEARVCGEGLCRDATRTEAGEAGGGGGGGGGGPGRATSSAGGGRPKACRPKPNKGAQCIPAPASCIIANA